MFFFSNQFLKINLEYHQYVQQLDPDQSKKEGKYQESVQSCTTSDPGYQRESNKLTIRKHKREPRGQPFPSRWPQNINQQTRMKAKQTQDRNNMNDPQKKYRIGSVSKNISLEGLNRFHSAKLFAKIFSIRHL